jgi:hypothetical protein
MPNAPSDQTVREGRDRYLAVNGFSMDAYADKSVTVDLLFGVKIRFPNTKARQRAIPLHDLHHVVTGYGTDLVGEAEIAAWELVGGCNSLVLYWLNGSAVAIGLLLAPLRVLRALWRARGQRTLYRGPTPSYEELIAMTVGELRERLGVPKHGQADREAKLNASARKAAATCP